MIVLKKTLRPTFFVVESMNSKFPTTPTELSKDFYIINILSNTMNNVITQIHESYYVFIIYQYLIL